MGGSAGAKKQLSFFRSRPQPRTLSDVNPYCGNVDLCPAPSGAYPAIARRSQYTRRSSPEERRNPELPRHQRTMAEVYPTVAIYRVDTWPTRAATVRGVTGPRRDGLQDGASRSNRRPAMPCGASQLSYGPWLASVALNSQSAAQ